MKIFCVLFLLFLNVSCTLIDSNSELVFLGNPEQALREIRLHSRYTTETGDVWQLPSTTHKSWKGDCDDWAGLYCSALIAYGEQATLVAGWYHDADIEGWHMAVLYKGEIISPQWYEPVIKEENFDIWIEYTFDSYLQLCIK
jgi:hypothetical protein